jgi:hypothetical protein
MAVDQARYPLRFDVDYPDEIDRLSTFFRLFFLIPIAIVGAAVGNAAGFGFLVLAPLLMILFRQKYPRWWFDWNLELMRFSARISAYAAVLTHEYPSTDEELSVHLEIDYPNAEEDLNRWLPLIKWLLAVPHYIVWSILVTVAVVLIVVAWFAILLTGRYPRTLFDFVVAVTRWGYRVQAYAFLMVTDRYPPFSLS